MAKQIKIRCPRSECRALNGAKRTHCTECDCVLATGGWFIK